MDEKRVDEIPLLVEGESAAAIMEIVKVEHEGWKTAQGRPLHEMLTVAAEYCGGMLKRDLRAAAEHFRALAAAPAEPRCVALVWDAALVNRIPCDNLLPCSHHPAAGQEVPSARNDLVGSSDEKTGPVDASATGSLHERRLCKPGDAGLVARTTAQSSAATPAALPEEVVCYDLDDIAHQKNVGHRCRDSRPALPDLVVCRWLALGHGMQPHIKNAVCKDPRPARPPAARTEQEKQLGGKGVEPTDPPYPSRCSFCKDSRASIYVCDKSGCGKACCGVCSGDGGNDQLLCKDCLEELPVRPAPHAPRATPEPGRPRPDLGVCWCGALAVIGYRNVVTAPGGGDLRFGRCAAHPVEPKAGQ